MATSKKKHEPTLEEIAALEKERREDNLQRLREGRALAAEVFKTTEPTFDQAVGVKNLLKSGVERGLIAPLMAESIREAGKFGGSEDTEIVLAIFNILLEDEEGAAHLAEALTETRSLFSATIAPETVLDVYYEIYGEDEEDVFDVDFSSIGGGR